MKKILLFASVLGFSVFVKASNSTCETFDSCAIDANNQGHTFNLLGNGNGGCLNNWEVVNGAPSVFNNSTISGITAYNGPNYALLNTRHDFTDGVALLYNFVAGKNYRVTLQAQTRNFPDSLNIDFILLQSQIPYTYNSNVGASTIAAVPSSGTYTAHSISGFSSLGVWTQITFDINAVPANYSRIWFRQNTATSDDVNFLFDNVCIEELPNPQAQCSDFDSCTIDANNQGHAFNLLGNGNGGCLNSWEVVNGAPSVFNNSTLSGITAYNGTNYALLNTRHDFTDGVALLYNFTAGKSYHVTFQAQTRNAPDNLDFDFILLQNQIPYVYNSNVGASTIASVPSGAYVANTVNGFNSIGTWTQVSFNINSVPNNYSRLWIRQNTTTSDDVNFLFDDFCIEEIQTSGINDALASDFDIFPNPAKDIINIKSENIIDTYTLYDLQGRVVLNNQAHSKEVIAYVYGIASGVYVMSVKTANGIANKRVVIE